MKQKTFTITEKTYEGLCSCWREHNDGHPVLSAPCCWFFHDIVEHSHVPLKHFARVGMIWTDIICRHQDRR